MQAGGDGKAGFELGRRRQHPAVRPRAPVVAGPREVQGPLAGRRAFGKRTVGSGRASQPAITVMAVRTAGGVLRAPMPAYVNVVMLGSSPVSGSRRVALSPRASFAPSLAFLERWPAGYPSGIEMASRFGADDVKNRGLTMAPMMAASPVWVALCRRLLAVASRRVPSRVDGWPIWDPPPLRLKLCAPRQFGLIAISWWSLAYRTMASWWTPAPRLKIRLSAGRQRGMARAASMVFWTSGAGKSRDIETARL